MFGIKTRLLSKYTQSNWFFLDNWLTPREYRQQCNKRILDALYCPDNAHIPRVPHAGRIENGCQIMHNGLKVSPGSYYGYFYRRMLLRNRGVHEPQEERVFALSLIHI